MAVSITEQTQSTIDCASIFLLKCSMSFAGEVAFAIGGQVTMVQIRKRGTTITYIETRLEILPQWLLRVTCGDQVPLYSFLLIATMKTNFHWSFENQ